MLLRMIRLLERLRRADRREDVLAKCKRYTRSFLSDSGERDKRITIIKEEIIQGSVVLFHRLKLGTRCAVNVITLRVGTVTRI